MQFIIKHETALCQMAIGILMAGMLCAVQWSSLAKAVGVL